jgi:tRNA (guanine37-N1)-methyltransferase
VIFHILTLFPEVFQGYQGASILGRARGQGRVELNVVDIRDFARDRHHTCDDYTYGGGAGMVLKPEPLAAALESLPGFASKAAGLVMAERGLTELQGGPRVVYLTPSGKLWRQDMAEELASESEVVLICGRYEGVDERIIELFVTDEISVGDYILGGGEVAAMVLVDTVVRLLEGVISEHSLAEESFRQGLLEYPQYTRPAVFRGRSVPEVLLSGHHAQIERWRLARSLDKTMRYRPELLRGREPLQELRRLLENEGERGDEDGQDQGD